MSPPRTGSAPLRWGLLLEEHPGATKSFQLVDASDIDDIPSDLAGTQRVCLCTLTIPGREPVTGWHESSATSLTAWDAPTTAALDQALINAGYPPSQDDLIFLMRWRFRNAEVQAVQMSTLRGTNTPEPPESVCDKERIAADDGVLDLDTSPDCTDPVVTTALSERVAALDPDQRAALAVVLEHKLIDLDDVLTVAQVSFVNKAIDNLTGAR